MSRARKFIAFGGTFSAALAIGFVMQNGDALAARFGAERPADTAGQAPVVQAAAAVAPGSDGPAMSAPSVGGEVPVVAIPVSAPAPERQVAPEVPSLPVELTAATADEDFEALPIEDAPIAMMGPECDPALVAVPQPAAMVRLSLSAPCHKQATATFHHQGMVFRALTDEQGEAVISVPALAAESVFIVELDGGVETAAAAMVEDLDQYNRAVVQWQGYSGLGIHALEYGASYGQPGHVWMNAMGDANAAIAGEGGFMVALGDARIPNAMFAEVYSFPVGNAVRAGEVSLRVEAEVTARNCGRDIAAQSIQIAPGGIAEAQDLTLAIPACSAVGEILVLSNMLEDLTLAAR